MNDELKPCPFCGSNNIGHEHITTYSTDSSYDVFGCNDCGARFEDGTPEEWNRRATGLRTGNATADVLDAEVKKLRRDLGRQVLYTDEQQARAEKAEAEVARLTAECDALRAALQRIADGRGVCGMCGTWAVGEGSGVTACDCTYPHWTFPDPAEVASAVLNNSTPHDETAV